MSKFSLSLAAKFSEIIFLHPFHDGIAVCFKIEDRMTIEERIYPIAKNISNDMNFKLWRWIETISKHSCDEY